MNEVTVKHIVIEELENLGIIIDDSQNDVDLLSMEIDSITFISFIVALEERFEIQFPDEYLTMEVMNSLNGFSELIYTLLLNKFVKRYTVHL